MPQYNVLITGAGTGFGREVAFRLAEKGCKVIAAVEIVAQVAEIQREAEKRNVAQNISVQKMDVTVQADRDRAAAWDIDLLLNNAGVSEGGCTVDIPEKNLRHQFEVNVLGPILLTQLVARNMVKKGKGRIVFMSSVAGLTTDPFTGAYSASKHAVEAFADALNSELKEFGIDIATVNPGPFLTGFNDRMFETWKYWEDDPSKRLYDYAKLAFPHKQMDPEEVYEVTVSTLLGESKQYRNIVPKASQASIRQQMDEVWERQQHFGDKTRPALIQAAYDLKPGTPKDAAAAKAAIKP